MHVDHPAPLDGPPAVAGELSPRLLRLLEAHGARFRLLRHAPEGCTVLASALRGHDLAQSAKSIVSVAKLSGSRSAYIVVVVPGDRGVDFQRLRLHLGCKRVGFAPVDLATRLAGCPMGAVPPFSFRDDMAVLLDHRLVAQEEIYFNAGRLDLSVALATEDYLAIADPVVGDFSRSALDA